MKMTYATQCEGAMKADDTNHRLLSHVMACEACSISATGFCELALAIVEPILETSNQPTQNPNDHTH